VNPPPLPSFGDLPGTDRAQIDERCDRFEKAWKAWGSGPRPALQEHLAGVTGPAAALLLGELLHVELGYRRLHGERPTLAEYLPRFPGHETLLCRVFAGVGLEDEAPNSSRHRAHDTEETKPSPGPGAGYPVGQTPAIRLRSLPGRGQIPLQPLPADLPNGRHELLGEIARGGMGVVLLARDPALGRELALKVLLDRSADHPEIQRRFLEEAQVAGQLQHPGIVPIHELGRFPDGRPFFTMKLIEGRTLAALLGERPDPTHELPHFLKVFEQVCQAVAYTHARGVVHRDLKPLNVMVGAFGEVQVMDWGLAKVLGPSTSPDVLDADALNASTLDYVAAGGNEADRTQPGQVLGTPAYMPPEQARGEVERLDERADVFSLGAILCVILTGTAPYRGASSREIHQCAARADLACAWERLDACGADPDLIALARACLAPNREDRPRDAGTVVAALSAYLAGVQERLRKSEIERAAAQARAAEERKRRQVQLALAATVLLAVLAGGGVWWWQAREQARRASEGTLAVQDALQEAAQKHEQARAGGLDPAAWTGAVAAVEKAEALLSGDVNARVRRQVEELATRVRAEQRQAQAQTEQAARDRAVLRRFDALRLELAEFNQEGILPWKRIGDGYARAFREYGLGIDSVPPQETVRFLRALPEDVRLEVINAVDLWVAMEWGGVWSGVREKLAAGKPPDLLSAAKAVTSLPAGQVGVWQRRLGVLQEVDPIGDRRKLRAAAIRLDVPALPQLTGELKVARLPSATLQLLTLILVHLHQGEQAVRILKEAGERHPDDFWIHYWLAWLPRGRGENAAALRAAEVALALRPNTPEVYLVKAERLFSEGDYDAARQALNRGLELSPDHPRCLVQLGWVCGVQNRLEEALACVRRAAEKSPTDPSPWRLTASVSEARQQWEEAATALRTAIRLEPEPWWKDHARLAVALEKLGRLKEMDEAARKGVRLHPDSGPLHYHLAVALGKRNGNAEALKECRKAVELDSEQPEAWTLLGRLLETTNQGDGALEAYREAVQRDPKLAFARGRLGLLLKAKGDAKAALAELREAVKLDAKQPEVQRGLAELREAAQDWDGAVAAWRAVAEQAKQDADAGPRLAAALRNQGMKLSSAGRGAEAAILFRESVRLAPREPLTYEQWALTLTNANQFDEAAKVAAEGLQQTRDRPVLWQILGFARLSRGKHEQALQAFDDFLRLQPDSAWGHGYRAESLRLLKRTDEARRAAKKAVELLPKDPFFHKVLAGVEADRNDLDAAVASYLEAIEVANVRYPQVQYELAEVLLRLEPEKARKVLARRDFAEPLEAGFVVGARWLRDGKADDYRKLVAQFRERFGDLRSGWDANLFARLASLDRTPEVPTARLVRLAELGVVEFNRAPYALHTLALAQLRAGQSQEAAATASEALKNHPTWTPQLNKLVLILADQQRGKTVEARKALEAMLGGGDGGPTHPVDAPSYRILLREAEDAVLRK
jgi:serine/threonine-protein kinase